MNNQANRTNESVHQYIFQSNEETCEHGLSSWLCMGPNHYPTRQDEMEGRYW